MAPSKLSQASGQADLAACRALLRGGSKSFFAASLLLPVAIRNRAIPLYAFCRLADDAVDLGDGSLACIDALKDRIAAMYRGEPADCPADRALARVIREIGLPQALLDALVEGFAWDVMARQYGTIEELHGYAARVAGCVGVMMTYTMGRRDADTLARAADLGVAMQLTNIARDVGEDARAGRLYLPHDWLREAGIDPERFLARPAFSPALARVVTRLLDAADQLYMRSEAGIAMLPPACRPAIRAASRIYRDIGRQIRANGCDSVSVRATTSARRKVALLAAAMAPPLGGHAAFRAALRAPALDATRFLLQDASSARPDPWGRAGARLPGSRELAPWWDIAGRTQAVLTIVERLERAERMRARAPGLAQDA
jgi:phytoene synthase